MSDLAFAEPVASIPVLLADAPLPADVAVTRPPTWLATLAMSSDGATQQAVRLVATADLAVHSACDFLPFYERSYQRVLASVRDRGVVFPLAGMVDGKVVDGRYRLRAAHEVGLATLPVLTVDVPGGGTDAAAVAAWAFTVKDAREHLSEDERAVLAVQHQRRLKGEHIKVRAAKMAAGRKAKAANLASVAPADTIEASKKPTAKLDSRKEACDVHKVPVRKFRAINRLAKDRPDLYADVVDGKLEASVALKRKGKNVESTRVATAATATVRPEDIGDGEVENRIHCGEAVDLLKHVGDGIASLVMFSPPYHGVPIPYDPPLPELTYEQYLDGLKAVLVESYRVSRKGGRLAVILDTVHNPEAGGDAEEMLPVFADVVRLARDCGWRFWVDLAWCKPEVTGSKTTFGSLARCSAPGWGRDHEWILIFFKGQKKLDGDVALCDLGRDEHRVWWQTTWHITGETRADILAEHPAPFPEALAERLIKLLTYRRDLVIDPYNGSGTTTAVAARLGRRFIGIDQSENYAAFARNRALDIETNCQPAEISPSRVTGKPIG